jgi:hypothetical protein
MSHLSKQLARISLLTTVIFGLAPGTVNSNTTTVGKFKQQELAQIPQETEIGFEVVGSQQLNSLAIPFYRYVGECPGSAIGSREAMFTNSNITPTKGLRVLIRNTTRGMSSDPFPYTDRKYERGRSSEPTEITFGYEHRGRYFVAVEGVNTYEYEIKQKNTVIDRGNFTATIQSDVRVIERNKREVTEEYCAIKDVPLKQCKKEDIRERTVMRCNY